MGLSRLGRAGFGFRVSGFGFRVSGLGMGLVVRGCLGDARRFRQRAAGRGNVCVRGGSRAPGDGRQVVGVNSCENLFPKTLMPAFPREQWGKRPAHARAVTQQHMPNPIPQLPFDRLELKVDI